MDVQNIDLVIFDCDGVLIDSEVISASILINQMADLGIEMSPAYIREHFLGRSFPTVAKRIAEAFGVALPDDTELRYRAALLKRFEAELKCTQGVKDVLARLNCKCCVATSSSPQRVARSLAIVGLTAQFGSNVFTASQVARGKPAPDLFLFAAKQMDVDPARALVIEDSAPGVTAAQRAQMKVLHFAGGAHLAGASLPPEGLDQGPPVVSIGSWQAFPADLLHAPAKTADVSS
ncbi:MAG: HAD-IA family hydrolase [Rhodobacteraceae bacterium]|nr:HAD-IA family hydrolase [Paracoccaceae bacterium]